MVSRQNQVIAFLRPFVFVTKAPHGPASQSTISRWLVEVISPYTSGPSRAHDVRGLASSRALFAGVNIQDILKAAAWRTPTTFVSCYLSDTQNSDAAFGRAALLGTANH